MNEKTARQYDHFKILLFILILLSLRVTGLVFKYGDMDLNHFFGYGIKIINQLLAIWSALIAFKISCTLNWKMWKSWIAAIGCALLPPIIQIVLFFIFRKSFKANVIFSTLPAQP